MFRHRNPSNFDRAGFRGPEFAAGVKPLAPLSPIPITESQISHAVENAVTVPQTEIVLVTAELPTAEPEANAEPEPEQDSLEPVTEQSASDLEGRAWDYANGLAGRFWDGLQNYKLPVGATDLRALQAELFSELRTLIGRTGEFFAAGHQLKMAALAEEHEAVRLQCRSARERREVLEKEVGPLNGILRRRDNEVSKARLLLTAEEDSKPRPEQYPSAREIKQWEARVSTARSALDAAELCATEARGVRNQLDREIRQQDELLDGRGDQPGLGHKFAVLDAQLKGKAVHDPETGLVITPEF